MSNYLYWFDCDLSLVNDAVWLEGIVSTVAGALNCQPMHASSPQFRDADSWLALFAQYPPTPESVFLMHGRTGRVDETLLALWNSSGTQGERLPRCRIVYSGGRDWDHLESMSFDNMERLCTVKANDFKWSSEEAQPPDLRDKVGEKFKKMVLEYVAETKSRTQRLRDLLAAAAERVYEATLITTAATLSGEMGLAEPRRIIELLRFGHLLLKLQDDWLNCPEYARLSEIRARLNEAHKLIRYENNKFDVPCELLHRTLFEGDDSPSVYKLIGDLNASLHDA